MLQTKSAELIRGEKMEFTDVLPGSSKADVWVGQGGAHGTFTKLKAGFRTPMHFHTYDIRMVVISGTLIFIDEAGVKTRLGPGSYCFVPAGVKHTTNCAENSNCLFYEDQSGKYDIRPAL